MPFAAVFQKLNLSAHLISAPNVAVAAAAAAATGSNPRLIPMGGIVLPFSSEIKAKQTNSHKYLIERRNFRVVQQKPERMDKVESGHHLFFKKKNRSTLLGAVHAVDSILCSIS